MRLILLRTINHLLGQNKLALLSLPHCTVQPFNGVLTPYVVRREQLSFSFNFLCIEVYLTDGVSL